MRGLLLVSCIGIPVPRIRMGEMSHAVFFSIREGANGTKKQIWSPYFQKTIYMV